MRGETHRRRHSAHSRYSHDQLALLGDWLEGTMVSRYSSEQYMHSKLELLVPSVGRSCTCSPTDVDAIVKKARDDGKMLPFRGGWGELAAMIAPSGKLARAYTPFRYNTRTRRYSFTQEYSTPPARSSAAVCPVL